MRAIDAIRSGIDMSDFVIGSYIGDLDDADLLVRPVAGMNPIAWQLGHLIVNERTFVELVRPGSCPPLPDGFEAAHSKSAAAADEPGAYATGARYRELWDAQRAATRAVLDGLNDAELDRSEPHFPGYAPTVGALLNMCGIHAMMHAGQFVAVRKVLGKPVVI